MLCCGVPVAGRGRDSEVRELLKDCLRLLMLNSFRTLNERLCGTGGDDALRFSDAGEMGFLNPPLPAWLLLLCMGLMSRMPALSSLDVSGKAPGM